MFFDVNQDWIRIKQTVYLICRYEDFKAVHWISWPLWKLQIIYQPTFDVTSVFEFCQNTKPFMESFLCQGVLLIEFLRIRFTQ